jgi:hypothetical protein
VLWEAVRTPGPELALTVALCVLQVCTQTWRLCLSVPNVLPASSRRRDLKYALLVLLESSVLLWAQMHALHVPSGSFLLLQAL